MTLVGTLSFRTAGQDLANRAPSVGSARETTGERGIAHARKEKKRPPLFETYFLEPLLDLELYGQRYYIFE